MDRQRRKEINDIYEQLNELMHRINEIKEEEQEEMKSLSTATKKYRQAEYRIQKLDSALVDVINAKADLFFSTSNIQAPKQKG